jgi:Flp pilus assembly protein TadG
MNSWMAAFYKWAKRCNRREYPRQPSQFVAFYWTGGASLAYGLRDVSANGTFILTQDRWCTGTMLRLLLQERSNRADSDGDACGQVTEMYAVVVRQAEDGMGVRFLFTSPRQQRQFKEYLRVMLKRGRAQPKSGGVPAAKDAGQSLVEFALLLPMLFLLIVNAVNFGGYFFAWITMASAARSAAQYAIMGGATINAPLPPTSTQVYNIVSADISSLPNRSSLAVRLCTNNNGTISCTTTGTGTFTNPAADARAESSFFVMAWVDVLYTYQPLIPIFNFSNLGVHATLPATRIHRQAVMRMLQ